MDLNEDQLLEIAFDSASTAVEDVPPELWGRVAQAGTNGAGTKAPRHPGWARAGADAVDPLSAFIDTAAEFGVLLDGLSDADWASVRGSRAPSCGTWSSTSWGWSATCSVSWAAGHRSRRTGTRTTGR